MKAHIFVILLVVACSFIWLSCQSKPAAQTTAAANPGSSSSGSASAEKPAQGQTTVLEVLASGFQSSVQEYSVEIIRDAASLSSTWAKFSKSPAPQFDFSKQLVVAVFMGTKNTGGYHYELGKNELKSSIWYVEVIESQPGLKEMVTMALTNPYIVFALPLTGKDPVITVRQEKRK